MKKTQNCTDQEGTPACLRLGHTHVRQLQDCEQPGSAAVRGHLMCQGLFLAFEAAGGWMYSGSSCIVQNSLCPDRIPESQREGILEVKTS